MVKKIQNQKILNESDSESQGEIQEKGMNQSQYQEKVGAKKSKEGKILGGGRGLDSSPECPTGAILKEESIPSTTHYYSPAPGAVAAPVNPQKTGHLKNICDKRRCANVTKKIKKQKKISNKQGASTSTSINVNINFNEDSNVDVDVDVPQNRASRKTNHRKYTVKKCSNYLRMTLKKNGFNNFKKLEGGQGAEGDRNRRGSTIYLPVCLLILKSLLKGKFQASIANYLDHLSALKKEQQRKFKATRSEKSQYYMLEFGRAQQAVLLFCQGKEQECIQHFFGAHEDSHKEKTYLKESINFYNQWKTELENGVAQVDPIDSDVQMMEIETPIQSEEDWINSCLTL